MERRSEPDEEISWGGLPSSAIRVPSVAKSEPTVDLCMSEPIPSPAPASFDHEVFAGLITAGWQMDIVERVMLLHVVGSLKPRVSIEIGTADGGSLSAIARHTSGRVFTLDIRDDRQAALGERFPDNVEFIAGPSRETLPALLARLHAEDAEIDFVLIDGDHSAGAVRRDIEDLLAGYQPRTRPLFVLMHDSFNPECRRGIAGANWDASPHVRRVQLDYTPGVFPGDGPVAGQMWGGFALAVLRPGTRGDGRPVNVKGNRQHLFETVRAASVHAAG